METVKTLANELLDVYQTHEPADFLSKKTALSLSEAYDVQHATIKMKCETFNEQVEGFKVSMTSPETQAFFDADEPAYGTLTTHSVLESGATVKLSELNEPLLEVELVVELTEDLTPDLTPEEVYNRVEVRAGIEVPDSRFSDWFPKFELMDLLADNGVTGHVVISEDLSSELSYEEVGKLRMELFHNDKKIEEGDTSIVMGHPMKSVTWLAKKLAEKNLSLTKGMVISSGSINKPIPLEVGAYVAKFEGIGEVSLTVEP
jgi:2-keto-4-pentenoate hydratase